MRNMKTKQEILEEVEKIESEINKLDSLIAKCQNEKENLKLAKTHLLWVVEE